MRLLIHGGMVVPGAFRPVLPRADILVENGRIMAVGRILPGAANRVDRVLDATQRIVIPGLINAHSHTHETFNRGVIPAGPTEVWALFGHPVLGVRSRTPDEVYWRTLVPSLEMLRNGVTTVVDDISMYFDFRDELVDAIMQAYRDSGIRAWVSVKVMDKRLYETLPIDPSRIPRNLRRAFDGVRVPSRRNLLEFTRRNIRKQGRLGGLARFIVNPSAPQRCTDELLRAVHRLAADYGFPYVIHVQETRVQAVHGPRKYGMSMIAHLERLGALSEITSIMHGVWLDDDDIRRVARAGATVVHNPVSNLRFGAGLAPVRSLLRAGVNVALGCDGTSSNDGQSVLEAMKFASILHNIANPDYKQWITPAESFQMATEGGAHSALWGDVIGTIEPGKRADLVLLDRRAPSFVPLRDVVAQLVYAEAGHAVRTVLVDGRIVVDEGRVTTADLGAAADRLQALGERLREEQERTFRIARRLEPLWRAMVDEANRVPLTINRLAWSSASPRTQRKNVHLLSL